MQNNYTVYLKKEGDKVANLYESHGYSRIDAFNNLPNNTGYTANDLVKILLHVPIEKVKKGETVLLSTLLNELFTREQYEPSIKSYMCSSVDDINKERALKKGRIVFTENF